MDQCGTIRPQSDEEKWVSPWLQHLPLHSVKWAEMHCLCGVIIQDRDIRRCRGKGNYHSGQRLSWTQANKPRLHQGQKWHCYEWEGNAQPSNVTLLATQATAPFLAYKSCHTAVWLANEGALCLTWLQHVSCRLHLSHKWPPALRHSFGRCFVSQPLRSTPLRVDQPNEILKIIEPRSWYRTLTSLNAHMYCMWHVLWFLYCNMMLNNATQPFTGDTDLNLVNQQLLRQTKKLYFMFNKK